MGEVIKQTMTDSQLKMAVYAAGGTGSTPVYRAADREPPESVRLTAESPKLAGGGRTKIVYFAEVYGAEEVAEGALRLAGQMALFTNWELWCKLPEALPGAHIGGLFIDQIAELPVGGVMLKFRVTAFGNP